MRKGFLKTFIVLGIFTIFIVGVQRVDAQYYGVNNSNVPTSYQNKQSFDKSVFLGTNALKAEEIPCGNQTCIKQNFKGGYYTISKPNGGTVDYYDSKNTKLDFESGFWNKMGNAIGALAEDAKDVANSVWNCAWSPISCAIGTGSYAWVQFSGLILYLSGNVFDEVFNYTISPISQDISQSISSSWKIVRDLGNLFIVFSLLYLGIKTILQGNGFAETRILVGIIIAAILINFSLIFVQTTFTISNTIGAQIGQQITFDQGGGKGVLSISAGLTKMIRPDNIGRVLLDGDKDDWTDIWNKVQFAIFTSITTLMLALILATSAILLGYRYIIFVVLMISAPFGIVSRFIPWFKSLGDKWWAALKSQFIVFPAFVLTLYISVLFVAPLSNQLSPTAFSQASLKTASAGGELVTFVFNFMFIIGFLLLPLILPGKLGAAGSTMMTNASSWVQSKVRSAPKRFAQRGVQFGAATTARGSRAVLGGIVGRNMKDGKTMKTWAQNTDKTIAGFAKRTVGQAVVKTGDGLQNKTYDLRNLDAVKKSDFGKGTGKGIESWSKAVKAKATKFDEEKKKEMKLFGFDKLHETDDNKKAIIDAQDIRDDAENILKEHKDRVKELRKEGASKEDIDNARKYVDDQEKELKKAEEELGKLKNIGDLRYMEQLERRMFAKFGGSRPSVTTQAAFYQKKSDLKKKWQADGESKAKKKDKAETKRIEKDLSEDSSDSGKKDKDKGGDDSSEKK